MARNYGAEFAKAAAAQMLQRHAAALIDLTAPDGLFEDATHLGWAWGFVPGTAIYGGTTEIYRNNCARAVMRLPR